MAVAAGKSNVYNENDIGRKLVKILRHGLNNHKKHIKDIIFLPVDLLKKLIHATNEHIEQCLSPDKNGKLRCVETEFDGIRYIAAIQSHSGNIDANQSEFIKKHTKIIDSSEAIKIGALHVTNSAAFKKIKESGCLKPINRALHFSPSKIPGGYPPRNFGNDNVYITIIRDNGLPIKFYYCELTNCITTHDEVPLDCCDCD